MRKGFISLLALIMAVSLCACGTGSSNTPAQENKEGMANSIENTVSEQVDYEEAEKLENRKDYAEAAIAFGKIADYRDARERSFANWKKVIRYPTIAAGAAHTVALKNDGTVVAAGKNDSGCCDVSAWNGIIAVAAGNGQTIGLKADHTVVAAGGKNLSQLSEWTDIVAVAAGLAGTFGLKIDGTVAYTEAYEGQFDEYDIGSWSDVVEISASAADSGANTVAYRGADGHVRVYAMQDYGQCRTGNWSGMDRIAVGGYLTTGLKNGKAYVVGLENSIAKGMAYTVFYNSLKTDEWSGLSDIAAGTEHVVGLKEDGTLTALHYGQIAYEIGAFPNNSYQGECDISQWKEVVAIDAVKGRTIALRENGTVLAVGSNTNGECEVSGWTDIKVPD